MRSTVIVCRMKINEEVLVRVLCDGLVLYWLVESNLRKMFKYNLTLVRTVKAGCRYLRINSLDSISIKTFICICVHIYIHHSQHGV